ncbi:type II toxin-antitoxin system VapC family toxin [Candidatus Pacearchaeota archaeon]|nr:type II toxin-antitoxin system VapC family toxin [Candidatus Pacearchaeota archaeon]
MYCLDTYIILDIFKGDDALKTKIEKINDAVIFISVITLCELYKGAFAYHDPENKVKEVDEFINSFNLTIMDENSCREFGKGYSKLKKLGKLIPEFDLILASIVKTNNLVLITKDKKHFENLGIKVEVW